MGLMHRVLHFSEPVYVESSGTAVGPKEVEDLLADHLITVMTI